MDPIRMAPRTLALDMTLRLDQMLDPASYYMTGYALPPLIVGLVTVMLGLLVLWRERASLVSVAFWLLTVIGGIWLLSYVGIFTARYQPVAVWWAKIENVAVVFIPSVVYWFTLAVVQRLSRHRRAVWVAVGGSTVFAWLILQTDQFVTGVYRYPWGSYARYGPWSVPFLVFFTVLMGVSLRLYWTAYTSTHSVLQKRRLREFLIGFAIASLGSVDYLAALGAPAYPIGYLPVFCFAIVSAHAIWRYRLVDVTPAFAAQQIVSTMADALLVVDCEGIIRVANDAAVRLLGRPSSELLGKPLSVIDRRFFGPHEVSTVIRTGSVERYETSYPTKERGLLALDVSLSAIPDRTGYPIGAVCIARDITERRRTEQMLRDSAQYAEHLVNTVREPVVVLDANMRVKAGNAAFYETFHVTPDAVRNRRIHEIGPGMWNVSKLRGMLQILPKDGSFEGVEIEYEFPETGSRILLINARRVFRQEDPRELILLAMEDVTERHRIEEQLKHALTALEALQDALRTHRAA